MYIYYNSILLILSRKEFIMNVKAILLDTQSIQKYIFSGTKLKTNVGASFIVDKVFDSILVGQILQKSILNPLGIHTINCKGWKEECGAESIEEVVKSNQLPTDCYVAYIGGGNALVLFKEEVAGEGNENLKRIVQEFTTTLLCTYPGLKVGAAIGTIQLDTENYSDIIKAMYQQLQQNKQRIHPVVNVPMTGHTLPCAVNGESANAIDQESERGKGDSRYVSHEVLAKNTMAKEANKVLADRFSEELGEYQFPHEFSKLGRQEGDNYLAIVHIDGNNMGERFSQCKTLAERTKLSKTVSTVTENAFKKVVQLAAAISPETYKEEGIDVGRGTPYLPLRPIIIGGDDVTFVCHARLAVLLAQTFMKELETLSAKELAKLSNSTSTGGIFSCAGIAILNTSYPFFRGYELAEQMCAKAKEKAREQASSWLDFIILHGEQAPTVEQIREQEYTSIKGGQLHFGPYVVSDSIVDNKGNYTPVIQTNFKENMLQNMLDVVNQFNDMIEEEKIGRNKVKGLRHILQNNDHMIQDYITQMEYRKTSLPFVEHWEDYIPFGWKKKYIETDSCTEASKYGTPYIDAIEMMEYLPSKAFYECFKSDDK